MTKKGNTETTDYTPPDQMAVTFYHFATASLAKSMVFQAISQTHFQHGEGEHREYISACITGYYSLLHLAISLMYFCPQTVDICLRICLYQQVKANVDPTKEITHKQAYEFLKSNTHQHRLPEIVSQQFETGRKIREYLNYAPRLTRDGLGVIFGTCTYSERDFDRFLKKNENVIRLGLEWGLKNTPTPENNLLQISISPNSLVGVNQYMQNDDLGYLHWLSQESLNNARDLCNKLSKLAVATI